MAAFRRQHIPNTLTFARGLAGLALIALFVKGYDPLAVRVAVCAIFITAAATDWLDGKLAREWDARTRLGELADPIADKLLCWAGLVILWMLRPEADEILAWLYLVIVTYDVFSLCFIGLDIAGKHKLGMLQVARVRSLVLQAGLGLFLLGGVVDWFDASLALWAFGVALFALFASGALTLVAALQYLWRYGPLALPRVGLPGTD